MVLVFQDRGFKLHDAKANPASGPLAFSIWECTSRSRRRFQGMLYKRQALNPKPSVEFISPEPRTLGSSVNIY